MTKRERPKRTMTEEQAQHMRQARVYEAMARLVKLSLGISSMTISSGRRSVTIDAENSPRMAHNARVIAKAFRKASEG